MGLLNGLIAADEGMRNRLTQGAHQLIENHKMNQVNQLANEFLQKNDFTREAFTNFVREKGIAPRYGAMILQYADKIRKMGPQWSKPKLNPTTGLMEQTNIEGQVNQLKNATGQDKRTGLQKEYDRFRASNPEWKGNLLQFIAAVAKSKRKTVDEVISDDLKQIKRGTKKDPNRMTSQQARKRLSDIEMAISKIKTTGGFNAIELAVMERFAPEAAKKAREGDVSAATRALEEERDSINKEYFGKEPKGVVGNQGSTITHDFIPGKGLVPR